MLDTPGKLGRWGVCPTEQEVPARWLVTPGASLQEEFSIVDADEKIANEQWTVGVELAAADYFLPLTQSSQKLHTLINLM